MVFENPREVRERTTKALKHCFEYFNKAYDLLETRKGRKPAHARDHVYPAALEAMRVAEENARKQGLDVDSAIALANLAGITGMVHDLIRRAGEAGKTGLSDLAQSDGFRTARSLEASRQHWLKRTRERGVKDITGLTLLKDDEFGAIIKAIRDNEFTLKEIGNKLESKPKLEKILLLALTWGDKGPEGLGAKVVKRRAEFVAGDRHDSDEEMKPFVKKLSEGGRGVAETKKLAFLLESLRRIRALKVVSDYPPDLRPEVNRLRKLEEDVYYSLIKHFGFKSEKELLEFGLKYGYPGLKEKKAEIEKNISAESEKTIAGTSKEKADEAAQLVLHYAHPQLYAKPSGEHANKWISEIDAESKRKPREEFEKLVKRL